MTRRDGACKCYFTLFGLLMVVPLSLGGFLRLDLICAGAKFPGLIEMVRLSRFLFSCLDFFLASVDCCGRVCTKKFFIFCR